MSTDDLKEKEDLTYRVKLLAEQLQNGKIEFAPHLIEGFKESFEKIRYGDDGYVIPQTVDSRIRALTIGLAHFKYRADIKSEVSLFKIQESYFKFLDINFDDLHRAMKKKKSDPNQAAHYFSRRPDFVKEFTAGLPDLLEYASEYWKSLGEAVSIHLEDDRNLKAAFGGDIFPSYTQNIASVCSLYIDTIILPCPLMRCRDLVKLWSPSESTYYILKHCLNALNYKDLALSSEIPIVAILPDFSAFDEHHHKHLESIAEKDGVLYANALFGRDFSSVSDALEYAAQINTPEELLKHTNNPDLLLFDTEWEGSKVDQINRFVEEQKSIIENIPDFSLGKFIVVASFGRMAQANDLIIRSNRLRATPLIDAPTSWRYFNWKLEHNSETVHDSIRGDVHLHVVRALQQSASTEFVWLGNIPPEDIIRIRKIDDSGEIRQILTSGLKDLLKAHPDNFFRTTDLVMDNIYSGFEKHQKLLKELRDRKMKFYGLDVASCLVVGGISIAASFMSPALAALSAGIGWLGVAPSPTEIKTKFNKLRETDKSIRESATGLFFKQALK